VFFIYLNQTIVTPVSGNVSDMLKSEPPFLQLHMAYIKPEHLGSSRLNLLEPECYI